MSKLGQTLSQRAEIESLRPDLFRGLRSMLAFMVPLALAFAGRLPIDVLFAAVAAQSIALVDVRGAYGLRFMLLAAMALVIAGAAALGALAGNPLALALAATVLIAGCTGLWRHLSSDYGPSVATSSSLLFFIAIAQPGGEAVAMDHAVAAFLGGLWGVALQVALWPIRPQHPLRVAVSDSWLAAADLFAAIGVTEFAETGVRQVKIAEQEAVLRAELDKAYPILGAAKASRRSPLVGRLEELNLAAARLGMRVGAFSSAQDALAGDPAFAALAPSFQPIFVSLTNTARSVALTVVSRQPAHLAAAEVRRERLTHLLRALQARLAAQTGGSPAWRQLQEILRQIEEYLATVISALRATVERAGERSAVSLELRDLQTLTLRPLASALNLSWQVDPALLRYTLRIAALTLLGVAFLKTHQLPHGYWLPFTMVVVLQPDYGSTRRKAAQRLLGTLAGSILASLMLGLHPSFAVMMAATAATSFIFGYFIKRNYGVAVIFITLFVVLLTEVRGPVTLALTAERLATTTAGGALAMLAALAFWPIWERDRFRPISAEALEANAGYLRVIVARLQAGAAYDAEAIAAKRKAETANGVVFSSLQRMFGDPKNRRDRMEQAAALANGNQRLTRALNLLALHLAKASAMPEPELPEFAARAQTALTQLAASVRLPEELRPDLSAVRADLDRLSFPAATAEADGPGALHPHWVFGQLARAATELSAMLLVMEGAGASGK